MLQLLLIVGIPCFLVVAVAFAVRWAMNEEGPRPSVARAALVPMAMLGVVVLVIYLILGAFNMYSHGWLW